MPETRNNATTESLVSLSTSYSELSSRTQTLDELIHTQAAAIHAQAAAIHAQASAIQRQAEESARYSASIGRMMEMLEQLQLPRADKQTTEAQPKSESGPELYVLGETDVASNGKTDAIGVDECSSESELESKADGFHLSPVKAEGSKEDDQVSSDLVLFSDSVLAGAMTTPWPVTPIIDEPYMYGKLPTKVFLVEFALDLGLQMTEVVEEIDGYKFVVPAGVHSISICSPSVCLNVDMDWFSYCAMRTYAICSQGYILSQKKKVRLDKPPAKPPDDIVIYAATEANIESIWNKVRFAKPIFVASSGVLYMDWYCCFPGVCQIDPMTISSYSDMLYHLKEGQNTLCERTIVALKLALLNKPPPLPPETERGYRGCSGQTSMISNHAYSLASELHASKSFGMIALDASGTFRNNFCFNLRLGGNVKGTCSDTDGINRPNQTILLDKSLSIESATVLDNIIYGRAYKYEHLVNLLLGLAARMSEDFFGFLELDFLISLFNVGCTDQGNVVVLEMEELGRMSLNFSLSLLVVNHDSFYCGLTREELERVHEYEIDHPNGVDTEQLECALNWRNGESVQGSIYDFKRRIRSLEFFSQRSVIDVIILKRASIKLKLEVLEAFQSFSVAEKISMSFLISAAFGNPKKVPSCHSSHSIGLCENFSDHNVEDVMKGSTENVARKLGKAIFFKGSAQFVIAGGSPTNYLDIDHGEKGGCILRLKEDDQQSRCSHYLGAFYIRLGITEFYLDYLILQPTHSVAGFEHKFSPPLSLMWRNCWSEQAASQPSCLSPILNILKVTAFLRPCIEFYSWMLAPLVKDMASVTHLWDHAHFIITNTYQEIAQVGDSHQSFTLTRPYCGIHDIDAFDTVFTIVSSGVDMAIYFYNDDYKRLTTRHKSIEVVIDNSLSDGRLDWVKNLMKLLFETAFLNLGFSLSLDDRAILVRYITEFIMFSLPRPPEVGDLEDKVDFKAGGMLRIGILWNSKGVIAIDVINLV